MAKPKRAVYNVIMKDMAHDHEWYWTKKIRAEIKERMTEWFRDITSRSRDYKGAAVHCWWSSNRLLVDPDELVVYFLPRRKRSLIKKVGGADPSHVAGGATFKTGSGMISEVYIDECAGDRRIARLLAILAFHELMHNKLDADPSHKTQHSVHTMGGAGKPTLSASNLPSATNKAAMAANLSLEIRQYTGHLFSKAVGKVPG